MSLMGRPRVLDDVKRGQICALLSAGCGLNAAARYVGCSTVTIRREALRNGAFRIELRESQVRAQLNPLRAMQQAAKTHWRAAAWLLERADPEQFDRRRNADVRPRQLHEIVDAIVQSAVDEIDDDKLRDRICRRLMAAAHKASRPLAAAERARLDPDAGPFDNPKSAEDSELEKFMADLERDRDSALQCRRVENHRAARSPHGAEVGSNVPVMWGPRKVEQKSKPPSHAGGNFH
jgi:hypothetical protein